MDIDWSAIEAEQPEAWDALLDAVVTGEGPDAPDVVSSLIEEGKPADLNELFGQLMGRTQVRDFGYWVDFAQQRLEASDKHFTISGPLGKFRAWFGKQALAGMDAKSRGAWPIRLELIQRVAADDGGLADATELFEDMEEGGGLPEQLAEVALLVVKGAFTTRDYVVARRYAMRAMKWFNEVGDSDRVNFAQRRLAAAMLYTGEVSMALTIFARAMNSRGPLFGGGGVQVFTQAPDPKTEAIDEARDISAWASSTTPEWVRASGGLALRWDDTKEAELLWNTFDELLDQMLSRSRNVESDIEVVVRHASQRDQLAVAERALRRYIKDYPDDDWAVQYVADIGRAHTVERVEAKWEEDPDAALDEGMALFEAAAEKGDVAESNINLRLADFLINHMLERKDGRAVEVQKALWDSKLNSWGECPAAWLEEQNLGTVYGELSQVERGLELLHSALRKQRDHFGNDEQQHVARTLRNIDRLNTMKSG